MLSKVQDKDDLVFSFLCRVTGGQLVLTDEADQHAFFEVERIPPNTAPRQVERIHDALRPPAPPVFRRQGGLSMRDILRSQ